MLSVRTIAMTVLMLASIGLSGCETMSMSAKAGPEVTPSNQVSGVCERKQNERSACDDQVGCYWDSVQNRCAAH